MSTAFTAIDLSTLPPPDVVQQKDFETIFSEIHADLLGRDPSLSALVESDPAYKILQVAAYREMILRQEFNDRSHGLMLAHADDADLEQIGANYKVYRLLVTPADPDAVPPVEAVYEDNESFRRRIQLSPEGYTTAGSKGSYIFHGLSADGQVKDVGVKSPVGGDVLLSVLSRTGDGVADAALQLAVDAALSSETVRPLCDTVIVQSAGVVNYSVEAVLHLQSGPDASVVLAAAQQAIQAYVDKQHSIGLVVALSGVYEALHVGGVSRVDLVQPIADVVPTPDEQVAYCVSITVTTA